MSHLPLDARAILHYLNELGYRNISAIQLKEFLKDLRKLIKYEERMGVNTYQDDYYESLFRRTTASYRAKIDRQNDKRIPVEKASGTGRSTENRKSLNERTNEETSSSSNGLLSSFSSAKSSEEKLVEEAKIDKRSIKKLIEKMLEQILQDKYSQEFVDKDQNNKSNGKSPIQSVITQIIKKKFHDLRHPLRENQNCNSSESGSLKSIIEDIVDQVLKEKFSNLQKHSVHLGNDNDVVKSLNQDLQQKLTVSRGEDDILPREPKTCYNNNRPLDSQSLIQELLSSESSQNKNNKHSKTNKENSKAGSIKRLQRSPRKKPEWQDPSLHDKVLDKPVKSMLPQSSAVCSSARSGRSSSVLIRRSKSQGRTPNSDPVALYQYYKNEWEHFRNQIPGETSHGRLRWNIRQRFLDAE